VLIQNWIIQGRFPTWINVAAGNGYMGWGLDWWFCF